jgi:NADPH2:quinone reductase
MKTDSTMQSLVVEDFDKASFRRVEIAQPQPRPGEVLVRIKASGVNPC